MKTFLQNHPGLREGIPRPKPDRNGLLIYVAILLLGVPMAIGIGVLKRLNNTGKIDSWLMYMILTALFLLGMFLVVTFARKRARKNISEQKKYYRLAGGLSWLPPEKREALQLEAHYCYQTGSWVETLEYWPAEVRVPGKAHFTTFQLVSKEDRLAANDQAWNVLSEKSYAERVAALFNGMHSRLFASDKRLMTEQNSNALIARLSELTQLPENHIRSCWKPAENKPSSLLWAFDLQRIVELSRTSFMAGIISEQQAWENILQASSYAHALFDNLDDFFNNYRIGHAYWSNDFKRTNEVAQMQKAFNKECIWPIKEVTWTKINSSLLPEVMQNSCRDYVDDEIRKQTRNSIGFRPGNQGSN